jgi:hypothetical protein
MYLFILLNGDLLRFIDGPINRTQKSAKTPCFAVPKLTTPQSSADGRT